MKAIQAIRSMCIALPLTLATSVRGAHECIVQVSQPIEVGDVGLVVSDVTYVDWWSHWDHPELEVRLTLEPNAVPTREGTINRNAASGLGVRLEFPMGDPNPYSAGNRFPGLVGDTLQVVLDFSAAPTRPGSDSVPAADPGLLGVTVECMKLNARRRWPRVRYLDVRIRGTERFEELARTYDLSGVVCSPRPRQVERGRLEEIGP